MKIFIIIFILFGSSKLYSQENFSIKTGYYDERTEELEWKFNFKTNEKFDFQIKKYIADIKENTMSYIPLNTFKINVRILRMMNESDVLKGSPREYEQYDFISFSIDPNWDNMIGNISIKYEGYYKLEFYDNNLNHLKEDIGSTVGTIVHITDKD